MFARAIAACLAALIASGCNVILDTEALKGKYDDSDLECEGGRLDPRTDLCWQDPSVCCYVWQEAIDYCEDLTLAGHSDWRLPSRDDFVELLGGCDSDVLDGDPGWCDSCDESEMCSALFGSDDGWYWSSSPYGSGYAWYGYLINGHVDCGTVMGTYSSVRCVRDGP